ncbi:IS1380 family transposase [Embleya sp. NPDC020630]|uniref:IS1380 family transposase n=1 Tax=Embleya sp. NPDC020630 TaxID=3363979 RepID=UPI00378EBD51
MKKDSGSHPRVRVESGGSGIVSQAGGVLLTETARVVGLDRGLSRALAPWGRTRAVHDPGKTVLDLAVALVLGGDCLADVAILREQPDVFGPVASDPTVSRLVTALAAAGPKAVDAIRAARAAARERAWNLARTASPVAGGRLTIDLDGVPVTAHSDKEGARPTWRKTFGFPPLWAFADHGPEGSGEPLSVLLRPGNAGSNTASDHIEVTRQALAQVPKRHRRGRDTLIRTDSAGGTHEFLAWLSRRGRWLSYSVGFTITDRIHAAILRAPKAAWTPACDADGLPREGAWVAEVTDMLDLTAWPRGMRVIVRKERPHPGAQLRITDVDGNRRVCFVTNTAGGQLADLEPRHRRRARAEDRIRRARATGLRNLPLHGLAQNRVWCELVALACELVAWKQMLALTGEARRWEIRKLRFRLFGTAARLVRTGRRIIVRLPERWPWTRHVLDAIDRLGRLTTPT